MLLVKRYDTLNFGRKSYLTRMSRVMALDAWKGANGSETLEQRCLKERDNPYHIIRLTAYFMFTTFCEKLEMIRDYVEVKKIATIILSVANEAGLSLREDHRKLLETEKQLEKHMQDDGNPNVSGKLLPLAHAPLSSDGLIRQVSDVHRSSVTTKSQGVVKANSALEARAKARGGRIQPVEYRLIRSIDSRRISKLDVFYRNAPTVKRPKLQLRMQGVAPSVQRATGRSRGQETKPETRKSQAEAKEKTLTPTLVVKNAEVLTKRERLRRKVRRERPRESERNNFKQAGKNTDAVVTTPKTNASEPDQKPSTKESDKETSTSQVGYKSDAVKLERKTESRKKAKQRVGKTKELRLRHPASYQRLKRFRELGATGKEKDKTKEQRKKEMKMKREVVNETEKEQNSDSQSDSEGYMWL